MQDSLIQFGGKKYFWGNVPAIDVLRMDVNEGKEFASDIRLLFAGMYLLVPTGVVKIRERNVRRPSWNERMNTTVVRLFAHDAH